MSLFDTGIRPAIDAYLEEKSQEVRDYGDYWSASSAGYCMRKNIFTRLKVPPVKKDARKTRVFEAGHIFHEWAQRITKDAGLSVAQEVELLDNDLMIKGHIDDLVLVTIEDVVHVPKTSLTADIDTVRQYQRLILYDYKTQNSRAFTYQKDRGISHFHKMQLGTYMYMLRKSTRPFQHTFDEGSASEATKVFTAEQLDEARILKISKDDLRMAEDQLIWTPQLEKEVYSYWSTLNGYWKKKELPRCTCGEFEGGFMAREAYNEFFYEDEPCSEAWFVKSNVKW